MVAGADGSFNLLEYADPELDQTLTEEHDKSMFDEHLGLKKGPPRSQASTQPISKSEIAELSRSVVEQAQQELPGPMPVLPPTTTRRRGEFICLDNFFGEVGYGSFTQ